MNKRVVYYSLVVSLGGFLFGFDTAVISGAEQAIQKVWDLSMVRHGFTVSIALFGTVLGALIGGYPSDKLGRKPTLMIIAVLYFVSAIGSALAPSWTLFLVLRFIGGIGVGASSVAAPMYISEIAPASHRGSLVASFQFNIVFGILVAFFSNYVISELGPAQEWRWMLGIEALPAFAFVLLLVGIPESPRWLIIARNKIEMAERIFARNGEKNVKEKVKEIREAQSSKKVQSTFAKVAKHKKQFLLAITFAMFNQLSGINAVIYYAPRIFEMTGLEKSASLLSSIGIGVINLVFTVLAMFLIDRAGRKKLMHIGSAGLICSLGLISIAFYTGDFEAHSVPLYLFLFIAFFAFSQGAVIWVFISEIFPNDLRGPGQSAGSFTHWILAALVAFVFPAFTASLGPANTFLIFTFMMILQWLFVWRIMPETKGRSLEEISEEL